MKDMTVGVLGGMGTYATIHLFRQYAEIFPAEKEWERPRIIIDNRCTMPSRVRAFLYNENIEQLVSEMTDSMRHLVDAGCNRIILGCNTSHIFLPQIYKNFPELKHYFVDIISNCVGVIADEKVKKVFLAGSEGTIESGIYQKALLREGIECAVPNCEEYSLVRECIEAVKQNKYTDDVRRIFINLVSRYDACILGCTELPILYEMYKDSISCAHVYDPMVLALEKLKEEYEDE